MIRSSISVNKIIFMYTYISRCNCGYVKVICKFSIIINCKCTNSFTAKENRSLSRSALSIINLATETRISKLHKEDRRAEIACTKNDIVMANDIENAIYLIYWST